MKHSLRKVEAVLLKLTIVQFLFLMIAQILLLNKEIAPYLSRTVLSEGIFLEYALRVMETLDHLL